MYKLVMYNKTYSSWSVRPWFAMAVSGIPFQDQVFRMREPDMQRQVRAVSPSGLLPMLIDGEVKVWDSLAIIEYLAEKHPDAGLWPADAAARAHARAICAEMHSGFLPLRREAPMNLRREVRPLALSDDAKANVARIEQIWEEARAAFGGEGPFLFGAYSAADAFYAPVVNRFHIYGVPVSGETRAYMDVVMALPQWAQLVHEGASEPLIAEYEDVA